MSTELAVRELSREQVDLVKRTIAKGSTDDELALFIAQCNRTGLDPFARQIYLVKRKQNVDGKWIEVATSQVSIDGFRLIAERSGRYDGQDEAEFCGPDGQWQEIWPDGKPPFAARVKVYRKDTSRPVVGIAHWAEYAQKKTDGSLTAMWRRMPRLMLAKCAESLALRKAFPNELSGLYTAEEMGQASPTVTNLDEPKKPPANVDGETGEIIEATNPEGQTVRIDGDTVTTDGAAEVVEDAEVVEEFTVEAGAEDNRAFVTPLERLEEQIDAAGKAGLKGWTRTNVLQNAKKKWPEVKALAELDDDQVNMILAGLAKALAKHEEAKAA